MTNRAPKTANGRPVHRLTAFPTSPATVRIMPYSRKSPPITMRMSPDESLRDEGSQDRPVQRGGPNAVTVPAGSSQKPAQGVIRRQNGPRTNVENSGALKKLNSACR